MEKYWIYGLGAALIMGCVISLLASSHPDGLERVAIDILGGEEEMEESTAGEDIIESPMPDYVIPGIENEALAASLSGLIGVLLMFILAVGIGKVLKK
ncbi:MAG: hypothetical protein A7316_09845 [Candidatus Altiarchaeales archaeon WOR_SM1_86-2]|nr:MAG: hypothetical protein A7316_09845 [Candidatus Altiarchaeales archaeon WOR_SM1_86-2]